MLGESYLRNVIYFPLSRNTYEAALKQKYSFLLVACAIVTFSGPLGE